MAHVYNTIPREVKTKGSGIQYYLWLHREFKVTLGYKEILSQQLKEKEERGRKSERRKEGRGEGRRKEKEGQKEWTDKRGEANSVT